MSQPTTTGSLSAGREPGTLGSLRCLKHRFPGCLSICEERHSIFHSCHGRRPIFQNVKSSCKSTKTAQEYSGERTWAEGSQIYKNTLSLTQKSRTTHSMEGNARPKPQRPARQADLNAQQPRPLVQRLRVSISQVSEVKCTQRYYNWVDNKDFNQLSTPTDGRPMRHTMHHHTIK